MKVRVNETLAKGLTNRLYDELQRKQIDAIELSCQSIPDLREKYSRNTWTRNILNSMKSVFEGSIIFTAPDFVKRKKKPVIVIFILAPEHIKGRLIVLSWLIDTKKCDVDFKELPIIITKHAIERVFLRLNSTNPEEVLNEVREALSQFILDCLEKIESNKDALPAIDTEIDLGSENGMFIGKVTEDRVVVFTTFVDTSKLSKSQFSGIT